MYLLHLVICTLVCSLQNDEKPQIATFGFQYRNAGMMKCVFCTCCNSLRSREFSLHSSELWISAMLLQKLWCRPNRAFPFDALFAWEHFFSLQHSARLPTRLSLSTRSFRESILFVSLEALRSSERRVVRIVGMVGLALDKTRAINQGELCCHKSNKCQTSMAIDRHTRFVKCNKNN